MSQTEKQKRYNRTSFTTSDERVAAIMDRLAREREIRSMRDLALEAGCSLGSVSQALRGVQPGPRVRLGIAPLLTAEERTSLGWEEDLEKEGD